MPILVCNGKFLISGNRVLKTAEDSPSPISLLTYDFNDLASVFASLTENDNVAIVIRHSERDSSGALTTDGISYAESLGAKLKNSIVSSIDDIKLYATDAERTQQTAQLIAYGMGLTDSEYSADFTNVTTYYPSMMKGSYFTSDDTSGWECWAKYANGLDTDYTFVDLESATLQAIDYFGGKTSQVPVSLFVGHDQFLVPFSVECSRLMDSTKVLDLSFYSGGNSHWITYLAGVIIISRADGSGKIDTGVGTYDVYPIRGLDRGYQVNYDTSYSTNGTNPIF